MSFLKMTDPPSSKTTGAKEVSLNCVHVALNMLDTEKGKTLRRW